VIVKANYCKKEAGERRRAKDNVRYIAHRRDREGNKVTRDLFGFDGFLSKQTAYRMIDDAPKKGRYYYRLIISPDPRREDRYKDLDLRPLTIAAMLKLEERYGKPVQFVAAVHDDHAPHRHVHTLVILNGRRLTRDDFASPSRLRQKPRPHTAALSRPETTPGVSERAFSLLPASLSRPETGHHERPVLRPANPPHLI
jgi:hypothetical protein